MEIERKFLVDKKAWEELAKPEGIRIIQGYLSTNPSKTIRVRVISDKAFMTIKGETKGISREEVEFEIPINKANELIEKFCNNVIEKTRFLIDFKGKTWEVDKFEGNNAGLLLAEIELNSENEDFEIPSWILTEVTSDYRYYNSYLSEHPYKKWSKE
ncbi:CYTH domain-containing protein [Tenuifilum thalassicum]|uniref:CYTH domain-containing protein n=1 Tax=Tenuifilum thalassicum TaxID=2590900 RepID=A0A7D4BEJ4_9BACT|nr:CYTH domain-containing protein [Tenuifilum thalassicum]QKG80763.1 CYTH domain-containing protein [Tenuifilum thalassicum]